MTNTDGIEPHDNMTAPVAAAPVHTAHAHATTDEKRSLEDRKEPMTVDDEKEGFEEEDDEFLDNLNPFPPLKGIPEEGRQLTVRAIFIGCCLGAIVSASNIYLGLKTSWTFGASLFGSILGFAILKPLSIYAPKYLGGGAFGPKENVACQTAATSAGGLGILFIGPIPAMYHLGIMDPTFNPANDIGKLITFGICTAYYGLFFAIALRKFYILKLKLIFPSPTAVAYTIRALHSVTGDAAASAKKKAIVLASAFGGSITLRVVSYYAPGILWDHHIFWWLYTWGWKEIVYAESWGWYFEYTPAFLGAGILSGMNASFSFFGGSVLAWAFIGPLTLKYGATVAKPMVVDEETGEDLFPGLISIGSLKFDDLSKVSPRYWNLWIGVFVMLCASFAEVAMNGPIMYRGMKRAFFDTAAKIPATRTYAEKHLTGAEREIEDPSPKHEQVPVWAWSGGLVAAIALSMIVLALQYNVSPGMTILAVILAFIFSFIAAQSSGATDINPVSTCAKSSQLVFGGITQGQGVFGTAALQINMAGGIVSAGAASQSVDMLGDLRTGYLLSASPYVQFIAQAIGSCVSIFLCVGLFILFAKAYPCVVNPDVFENEKCFSTLPSVVTWAAIANGITKKNFPVPSSSAYTALAMGLASVALVAAKYMVIPKKYHGYVPNMNAVGLAFTLPDTKYSTAMAVGALASHLWHKKAPRNWNNYAFSLAAGLSAGEGIGGVIGAVLTVAGVGGGDVGSAVGCPAFEYCG